MTDRDKLRVAALLSQQYEVECLLSEALGYVYEADHGWVIGDHTIVTLAMEVRRRGVRPGNVNIDKAAEALWNLHTQERAWDELSEMEKDQMRSEATFVIEAAQP